MSAAVRTGQWATFFLANEQLALPVEAVQEVLLSHPLTPVPLAPREVLGLLNLRGAVMLAIDLRAQLGFEAAAPGAESKMIVLTTPQGLLCLVVDDIGDVIELRSEGWQPVPDTISAARREAMVGLYPMEGSMILGLRPQAVMPVVEAEPENLQQGAA